ncbi:GNAT family N-acetyltransferase [Streptomyces sp. NPDC000594]|uniref:GNAT family N-acetyltransferase n=1 Tax=Streptomyces sp. NPDC000594 TaxID=3154261 RepID=UPI0033330DC9
MSEPRIRPARPGDEAALARLDHDTWSTLHAVLPRSDAPRNPFFQDGNRPEDLIVAEGDDGGILGYIKTVFPTPLECNRHVRQIQGLVVARTARGRGVGRALIRAARAEAHRAGARRITLRVLGHNAPARALYAAEGFVVEGVLPGEFLLDGVYVDDILMGRPLP